MSNWVYIELNWNIATGIHYGIKLEWIENEGTDIHWEDTKSIINVDIFQNVLNWIELSWVELNWMELNWIDEKTMQNNRPEYICVGNKLQQ